MSERKIINAFGNLVFLYLGIKFIVDSKDIDLTGLESVLCEIVGVIALFCFCYFGVKDEN